MTPITALTALPLVAIYIILSYRVIIYRRKHLISLGDHNDVDLMRMMRGHSNFIEYAPFGLILLALLEINAAPVILSTLCAVTLVIGRALHAYAFSQKRVVMRLRVYGMALTFLSLILAAVALFILVIINL